MERSSKFIIILLLIFQFWGTPACRKFEFPHNQKIESKKAVKWPNRTVYYFYDHIPDKLIENIKYCMNDIQSNTPLKFVEENTTDALWIYHGEYNRATVGYTDNNFLELHSEFYGVIFHELLHVVGLRHEQQRADREDYIVVKFENIIENRKSDFRIMPMLYDIMGIRYDEKSIMHYNKYKFSKNKKPTIEFLNKSSPAISLKPTVLDYKKVNLIYQGGEE